MKRFNQFPVAVLKRFESEGIVDCAEEFAKGHRVDVEETDLSDREGSLSFVFLAFASVVGFAHGQPKKRPCDDDGQLRHFLVEVFEGVERLVGLL